MSDQALKDAIFATTRSFRTQEIQAFGQTIKLKQLSAAQLKDIGLRVEKADPSIHNNVFWVIACALDDSWNRIFDWTDVDAVNGLAAAEVNKVAEAALLLNTGPALEQVEKNSEASPN